MAPPAGTAMIACVLTLFGPVNPAADGATPGFQPRIVPSSVSNRKTDGAVVGTPALLTPEIMKAPAVSAILKTSPVGVPSFPMGSAGAGPGMKTTNGCGVPAVLYSVEVPVALFDTQKGEPDDSPTPHGFWRLASTLTALWTMPLASINGFLLATRSVSTKPAAKATPVAQTSAPNSEAAAARRRRFFLALLVSDAPVASAASGRVSRPKGDEVIMRGAPCNFYKRVRRRPVLDTTRPLSRIGSERSRQEICTRVWLRKQVQRDAYSG